MIRALPIGLLFCVVFSGSLAFSGTAWPGAVGVAAAQTEPAAVADVGSEVPAATVAAPAPLPEPLFSDGWPSRAAPPTGARPHVHHELGVGNLILGAALVGLGYVGSIAWAAYYFDALPIGVPGCNDLYAGLHLIPVVGPIAGAGAASSCTMLRAGEWFLSVALSAVQLAGLVPLLLGIVGGDEVDYDYGNPTISVAFDEHGGAASLSGRF